MKKDLINAIKQAGSLEVSHATLRDSDLIEAHIAIVREYKLRPRCFAEWKSALPDAKLEDSFRKSDRERWEKKYPTALARVQRLEYISHLINEEIMEYFSGIAPKGYYYGTLEGDASCFGFWKIEEEMTMSMPPMCYSCQNIGKACENCLASGTNYKPKEDNKCSTK